MTACKRLKLSLSAAILAGAVLITTGYAQRPVSPTPAPEPKVAIDPHAANNKQVMLDDRARMATLITKAGKLMADKKTAPIATLTKQLSRKTCELKLPPRGKKRLTRPEIYSRNVSGVLVVAGLYKCGKCVKWHASAASGFVISSTGAIATNHHLFESSKKSALVAMTHTGKVYPVKEVLAASKADDAVILQLDTGGDKLTALSLAADTPVGTDVTVISHPKHRFYTLSAGVISRYSRQRSKRGMMNTVTITADFARGSSGGPIFDPCGNATAMVASTSSVYYTETKGVQKNLQMVFKQCVPAASILKLAGKPAKK
jgi:serine protease Do